MQRKTFLALTTGGLLATILGDVHAQEENPRRLKRFTPQKPPEDVRDRGVPGALQFTYSLIEERPGVQVYSSRFNEIVAVVLGDAVEWVATPVQIKRVDRKRNEVRLYDRDDGLAPGTISDLVGEGNDVYVLVEDRDGVLVLCVFDTIKDRFERFPLVGAANLRPRWDTRSRHPLVLGQETVAFVPELMDPRLPGVPPFYTFDRRARKLEVGRWPQEPLASPDALTIAFAAVVGSTLWLGTQVGGLGVPLPAREAPARWSRSGPRVYVRCGAALPDGALLLLTQESLSEKSATLLRLDPKTGQTSTVSWGSFILGSIGSTPILIPDGAGGLWQINGVTSEYTDLSTIKPSVHRLKSLRATTWEQVDWSNVDLSQPIPPGGRIILAGEETLPTPVAAALVCYLKHGVTVMSRYIDQDMWLRQRFWRWRSPEPPEFTPGGIRALQSPGITDTKDQTKTWLGEQGGFALVPKRELDLPSSFGRASQQQIEKPGAQHFSINASLTQTPVAVRKLLRGRVTLAVTEDQGGLLRLTKKGTAPLIPPDPRMGRGFLSGGLVAGPSQTRFVSRVRGGVPVLQRWDEKKLELSTTVSLEQVSGFGAEGTRQGIWLQGVPTRQATQPLYFLAVAPDGSVGDTWETLTLELPTKAQWLGFGATAIWFQGPLSTEKSVIHAWDTEKRCWSSIVVPGGGVLTPRISFQTVESPDGSSWLFLSGANPGLLRYDPTGPTLELVSAENTALPSPKLGMVLAATRDAVWVAGLPGCWRYDRAKQSWSKPEQAQEGLALDSHYTDYPYYSIPDTDGSWWVGGNRALWRFDPVRGSWQEQIQEVLPELGIVSSAVVTDDTVWGMAWTLGARLDRKTGKSRTYGPESGVTRPQRTSNLPEYSLQGAGGRIWMLGRSSLLSFDEKADRFVPVTLPKESNPVPNRYFVGMVSDPWRPQGVIVADVGGDTGRLYRVKGSKFDPISLPLPPNIGIYCQMAAHGRFVYIGTTRGLWRIDASGRWERIIAGGYITRFVRDTEHADILWALGGMSVSIAPEPIVRLGPG